MQPRLFQISCSASDSISSRSIATTLCPPAAPSTRWERRLRWFPPGTYFFRLRDSERWIERGLGRGTRRGQRFRRSGGPTDRIDGHDGPIERDARLDAGVGHRTYIGWEQAARKLIPTPLHAAQFDLTRMVQESGAKTTGEAVDYLMWRMVRVPAAKATRDRFATFLTEELGTDSLDRAKTYMEDSLRMTAHLIMSTPEYQIV